MPLNWVRLLENEIAITKVKNYSINFKSRFYLPKPISVLGYEQLAFLLSISQGPELGTRN